MRAEAVSERRNAGLVAAGKAPADKVLRGGRIVNVHTGLLSRGDVAIAGNRIAATGDVEHTVGPNTEIVDCHGMFLMPGFIDSHMHTGGSQLTVQRLAEVMVPHGTVAITTDFYEMGYIGGRQAILNELDAADGTGLRILLSVFNASVLGIGAFGNLERFSYDDMLALMDHPDFVELREWNCWSDWLPLAGQQEVYAKALTTGKAIGGHLEGLTGPNLHASAALGASSEHEAVNVEEAMERVRLGMTVQVRGGSAARDFDGLVPAITERGASASSFAFCTDELELPRMAHVGHIDRLVRMAVSSGIAPIDAIRMATINAARSVGADRDFGSITPGHVASIVATDDLSTFPIRMVLSEGVIAARDGEYLLAPEPATYPAEARQTVNVPRQYAAEDFLFDRPDGVNRARVVGLIPGKLLTEDLEENVELVGGRIAEKASGLAKLAVIDRHSGEDERFVGLIRGSLVQRGAIAATVNPGMMNLISLGVDEGDMAVAANRVAGLGGGMCVVVDGEVIAEVALPIYGIVSDAPSKDVLEACDAIEAAVADNMGCSFDGLLSAVGFACLAVSMPSLKITARGLARVTRGEAATPVELFVHEALVASER